jgi:voltage-gated potassium channel
MSGEKPTPPVEQATPRQRRLLLLRTAVKALLTTTVLVTLYYVLPMNRGFDAHTVLLLTVYLAVFAVVLTWRVRGLFRSRYPGLRAVETLALVVPLYLLLFATTYFLAERADGGYFSQPLTRSSALYFSVTVFSTVGFGDIVPTTDPARLVVTAQMLLDVILLGFGVRVFVGAVNLARERHGAAAQKRLTGAI